jgi:hypothetical protein
LVLRQDEETVDEILDQRLPAESYGQTCLAVELIIAGAIIATRWRCAENPGEL